MPTGTVGRILRSADFQRVLACSPRARSTHFALHHLAVGPALAAARASKPSAVELSTGGAPVCPPAVDESPGMAPSAVRPDVQTTVEDLGGGAVDTSPGAGAGAAHAGTADATAASADVLASPAAGWWLGLVVPKRHARRAATRNLIKRQARALMLHGAAAAATTAALPRGLWVLRLKSPFDVQRFPSASSAALRQAVRGELDLLLSRALQPAGPRASPPLARPSTPRSTA